MQDQVIWMQDAREGTSRGNSWPKPTPQAQQHPKLLSTQTHARRRPGWAHFWPPSRHHFLCFGVWRDLEFPIVRDQHGLWSHFPKEKGKKSFQQHLLSSFSYLIKALVSLSDPDRFLAILALLLGYSRAPALATVSFP